MTCCASREELPPGSSQPPCTTWPHSGRHSQWDTGIRRLPAPSNPECSVSAAPSWESVYGLTFSPYRGLFLLSPFLLLAPAGFYAMFRRDRRSRDLATVLLLIIVALFTYNVCYWSWSGADAAGPRHLVSLLPFLSLPIILVLNRARRAWQRAAIALLIGISIIEVWILSLAGQSFPSEMVARPILDYALPLVRAGQLRFNLGTAMGLHGLTAVIPCSSSSLLSSGAFLGRSASGSSAGCDRAHE